MLSVPDLREVGDAITLRLLSKAFAHYPSGVIALCGLEDEKLVGMAASSFVWASLDPPLVGFFADRHSRAWRVLREIQMLGVSVLSQNQGHIARQIASRSRDRFEGVPLVTSAGAPILQGATASFVCRLHSESDAGDHILVLLEVLAMDADSAVEPLIYHRSAFRELTTEPKTELI